jgi:hypothetical protein
VPIPDAVETLTAAWTIAYKSLGGTGRGVATSDLLSGRASTFGAGLDEWRRDKARLEVMRAQMADESKKGVFGKAKGVLGFGKSGSRGGASEGGGGGDEGGEGDAKGGGATSKMKGFFKKLVN